ncbi:MAG: histidinol-phosphatase, partial [Kiritimatiellae bacterium]|nr:histidinol-phosphatase [Kiritimatiellia bacterium]
MDKAEFFKNGSRWLRADFHLHTKSDTEFQRFNGTDSEFTSQYIAQLKRQDIGVGVVTNHNKFNKEEFSAMKKAADAENIYLLPGMEFSLRDGSRGTHLLIVFDYDWIYNREQKDYIQIFLNTAFVGIPNCDSSPYPNSKYTLQEVVTALAEFN